MRSCSLYLYSVGLGLGDWILGLGRGLFLILEFTMVYASRELFLLYSR